MVTSSYFFKKKKKRKRITYKIQYRSNNNSFIKIKFLHEVVSNRLISNVSPVISTTEPVPRIKNSRLFTASAQRNTVEAWLDMSNVVIVHLLLTRGR